MTISGIVTTISNVAWQILIPFLVICSIVMIYFFIRNKSILAPKEKLKKKDIFGPSAVGMGSMIGTGAIIGVLTAINKMVLGGQYYFEAIVFWAFIGAFILIPIVYFEVIIAKFTKSTPRGYVTKIFNKKVGLVFTFSYLALYVFGFGGFQFSGINSVTQVVINDYTRFTINDMMTYIFVILPLILIIAIIILKRKHELFIGVLGRAIFFGTIVYTIFLILFLFGTSEYLSIFFERMWIGVTNPVNALIGLPIGLIIGWQRIVQTAEPGLSSKAMSSLEADNGPRPASIVAVVPTIFTIFLAVFGTTYIASYAVALNVMQFPATTVELMSGFYAAADFVLGTIGILSVTIFLLLAGFSTILSSYYFLDIQLDIEEKLKIRYYLITIFAAGTVAVFGFSVIFDIVDLLMFVVIAINVAAMTKILYKLHRSRKKSKKEELV